MGPGGPHGLQNRRVASSGVIDGFDSHSLPPFGFNDVYAPNRERRARTRGQSEGP